MAGVRAHVQRPSVRIRRHAAGQEREHVVDHVPYGLTARRLSRGRHAPADLRGERQGKGVACGEVHDGPPEAGVHAAGFDQRGRLPDGEGFEVPGSRSSRTRPDQ
ncbi:hypothetical protein GCM10020219_002540 [Nonomuraea dietziae]